MSNNKLMSPHGKMFIFTIILGLICSSSMIYLLYISIVNKRIYYLILSIIGLIISIIEVIKMLRFKLTLENDFIYIKQQNFSWKFWQSDSQKIMYSNIKHIFLQGTHIIIIQKNNKEIKLWCLPFSKKQIKFIIKFINERIV